MWILCEPAHFTLFLPSWLYFKELPSAFSEFLIGRQGLWNYGMSHFISQHTAEQMASTGAAAGSRAVTVSPRGIHQDVLEALVLFFYWFCQGKKNESKSDIWLSFILKQNPEVCLCCGNEKIEIVWLFWSKHSWSWSNAATGMNYFHLTNVLFFGGERCLLQEVVLVH